MADFEDEEDLIIDEKKDDIPIKLKLSIRDQRPCPPTSPKNSLKSQLPKIS